MLGLLFAYEQALPGTKSFVTALFLLTIFVADTGGAFFADHLRAPVLAHHLLRAAESGLIGGGHGDLLFRRRRFERASGEATQRPRRRLRMEVATDPLR